MHQTNRRAPIPVVIDDRETRSAAAAILHDTEDFATEIRRLKTGDYLIDNRFLFERKTLPDLIQSINSGRLFAQSLRLAESPAYHPALILEGTTRDLRQSNMSWHAIQGALVAVTLLIGLPILRTRTPKETVLTFHYAARQSRARAAGALPRPGQRPKGKRALQLHLLQGLPGIGPKRAAHLLERFGNITDAINADPRDLAEVTGIGKETARRIQWAVKERKADYG